MADYVTHNKENSLSQFNKKFIFIAELVGTAPNIVNFYGGEKILYGRVSPTYIPHTLKTNDLARIDAADPTSPQRAVSFVAAVFNRMCANFEKSALRGDISPNHPYLTNLKAYRSYTDPKDLFYEYREIYYTRLGAQMRSLGLGNVRNFDEFVKNLMTILKDALPAQPLTFPGFLKTSQCSTLSTGLAIEVAPLDYKNDMQKVTELTKSPNWKYFVNTCNQYGFMIDAYNPFRIVADVNSDYMRDVAAQFGYRSFLLQGFDAAPAYYIRRIVAEMLRLYQLTVPVEYVDYEHCADGTIRQRLVRTKEYTPEDLNYKYSARFWMRLYMQMRLYEEKPELTRDEHERIINMYLEAMAARKSLNPIALGFENIINKPFDKSGSAGYTKKKLIAMANANFDRGTTDNISLDELLTDFVTY